MIALDTLTQGLIPWWRPFLSRLNNRTALVGSTISCQGGTSEIGEDVGIPHVQSSVLAMSQVRVACGKMLTTRK